MKRFQIYHEKISSADEFAIKHNLSKPYNNRKAKTQTVMISNPLSVVE